MLAEMADAFCMLKRDFYGMYRGGAHIQEIIPEGGYLRISGNDMADLHRFAAANPIYHDSHTQTVSGVRCVVYEGDINQYWIDSIKNPGSAQPFYPTWMLSAYLLALAARESGCAQLVDVGSGDGRIAFCGRLLGMDVCSIEIDESLAALQRRLSREIGMRLDVRCADAASFDYDGLCFERPAVFTGGLPQMGDILAAAIVERMSGVDGCRFVLAGSRPRGVQGRAFGWHGWGGLMEKFDLEVVWSMSLPTVWTFDQPQETPYICVEPAGRGGIAAL